MQKTMPLIMAGVLLALATPAIASHGGPSAQECWQPAFEAGDADAVAQCYAEDAVLWLPGTPKMQGRDAIREGYADFFSHYRVQSVELRREGEEEMGDASASWGSYTMVIVSSDNDQEITQSGRYTDVSRLEAGQWVYVVDHASDDPPAAPTE